MVAKAVAGAKGPHRRRQSLRKLRPGPNPEPKPRPDPGPKPLRRSSSSVRCSGVSTSAASSIASMPSTDTASAVARVSVRSASKASRSSTGAASSVATCSRRSSISLTIGRMSVRAASTMVQIRARCSSVASTDFRARSSPWPPKGPPKRGPSPKPPPAETIPTAPRLRTAAIPAGTSMRKREDLPAPDVLSVISSLLL